MSIPDIEFTHENVLKLLEDIKPVLEDDQLSGWETSFVKNIIGLVDTDVDLTEMQFIKLREIWSDYVN